MNKEKINLKPDYRLVKVLKLYKDKILGTFVDFLLRIKIHPDIVSLFAFLLIIPIFFLFPYGHGGVIALVVINVLLDSLDGTMARRKGVQTKSGALIDLLADHLFMWFLILIFYYYGFLRGVYPVFYLFNYVILTYTLLILNFLRIKYFFVFKSVYLFYLVYFVFVVSNQTLDLFYPYFMVLSVYMLITNILLFWKLKNSV